MVNRMGRTQSRKTWPEIGMRRQLDGTSWVNREVHAQICGGRRGKFPPPTRQGWIVTDPEALTQMNIPGGETAVEIPEGIIQFFRQEDRDAGN